MNLLHEPWLSIKHSVVNENISRVALSAITSNKNSSIIDIIAPRADFRVALYQFLIGLLQTAYAPDDIDEWSDRWNTPPTPDQLKAAFAPYADAFNLDSDGPAFMQDFDAALAGSVQAPVRSLLIDAGSESNEYFNKPGQITGMCECCVASALFTLQINAPSGGRGHRTSLRGGGPLTTLLVPRDRQATLWQKLWLNVLPKSEIRVDPLNARQSKVSDILPWLAPTRVSDTGGSDTAPELAHPLQAYWSMPRRIRLDFSETKKGTCEVCGEYTEKLVTHYRTRHGGINYTGAWTHPLTPYNLDPNNEKPPLSTKGQKGGIGYKHWLGLTLGNDKHQPDAAQVVRHFVTNKSRQLPKAMRDPLLWCFGFDMDNMKARCWYDATLPVHVVPTELMTTFVKAVSALLDVANEASGQLAKHVKAARFSRPGDAGNEPAVPQSFWQSTESVFYTTLDALTVAVPFDESGFAPIYLNWLSAIRTRTLDLFDEWVLTAAEDEMNMRRIVAARYGLRKWLNAAKPMKEMNRIIKAYIKEAA